MPCLGLAINAAAAHLARPRNPTWPFGWRSSARPRTKAAWRRSAARMLAINASARTSTLPCASLRAQRAYRWRTTGAGRPGSVSRLELARRALWQCQLLQKRPIGCAIIVRLLVRTAGTARVARRKKHSALRRTTLGPVARTVASAVIRTSRGTSIARVRTRTPRRASAMARSGRARNSALEHCGDGGGHLSSASTCCVSTPMRLTLSWASFTLVASSVVAFLRATSMHSTQAMSRMVTHSAMGHWGQ
mmetsp:Transcript_58708/g.136561  ORF Transcript_58708/g.136561 Transcript_58708/m.136561 type:complete len:248 (-) Transcript_58708:609-1352(-)